MVLGSFLTKEVGTWVLLLLFEGSSLFGVVLSQRYSIANSWRLDLGALLVRIGVIFVGCCKAVRGWVV